MISLALLGCLQAILLPGLVLILWASKRLNIAWQDKLLFATPLSITLNYLLVSSMTWADLYVPVFLQIIILIELLALALFVLTSPPQGSHRFAISDKITINLNASTALIALQAIAFFLLFITYSKHSWSIFTEWDAVVSWNRWAKDWFNQSPGGSIGYPPGLPIMYSLVYKAAGTINIQTLAKTVAAYFPFFGLFCLWRIGSLNKSYKLTSIIASLVFIFVLQRGYGSKDFIFSGYTDPLMAALGAFSLYALVLVRESVTQKTFAPAEPNFFIGTLIVLALTAPALIKQNGVILAALTVFYGLVLCRQFILKRPWHFAGLALVAGTVAIHWYIYSYFKWHDYYVASDTMTPNLTLRAYKALGLTAQICSYFVIAAMFIGLTARKEARALFFFMLLPLWLFWALVVSYDFRTAFYAIPVIAVIAGFGIERVCFWTLDRIPVISNPLKTPQVLSTRRLLFAGLVVATTFLLILPHTFPSKRVLASNDKQRIKMNDAGFNREAVELFARSSTDEKTLSCWQMLYNLPGAEGKFIPYGNCDIGYEKWLSDRDIKYFIYWETAATPPHNADDVRTAAKKAGVVFRESKLSEGYLLFEKLY